MLKRIAVYLAAFITVFTGMTLVKLGLDLPWTIKGFLVFIGGYILVLGPAIDTWEDRFKQWFE
jgi:hypothetical protein